MIVQIFIAQHGFRLLFNNIRQIIKPHECSEISHLQREQPIFKLNFLGQKIGSNCGLVLITKLTIHIPKIRKHNELPNRQKINPEFEEK